MGWRPTPEQRAALIRAHELASQMSDDGTGPTAIAARLTADGYPTMHGGPWTYPMVQRFLRKPPPVDPTTTHATRHWRLADRRGPAKLLKCIDCAAKGIDKYAYDWSWRHGTDPEDVMNYDPRCRKCHIAYDGSGHHTPHTEEAKAKMSEACLLAYAEGRRTAGGGLDGKHTEEAKAKMSESHKQGYAEGRRIGANTYQSGKTHCAQDHPYDETNTYYAPDGTRGCKECRRENVRRWRRKRAA